MPSNQISKILEQNQTNLQLYSKPSDMELTILQMASNILFLLFLLNPSFACTNGLNYCLSCINGAQCGTCSIGYGRQSYYDANGALSTLCTACQPTNCLECDNYNSCSLCADNYRITSVNGLNNCEQCIDLKCKVCNSGANICNQCIDFFRVATNNRCQRCSNFYCMVCDPDVGACSSCCCSKGVNSFGNCIDCSVSNCVDCSFDYTRCRACSLGMGVHSNQCINCTQQFCVDCAQDASSCQECSTGYGIDRGQCLPCSSRNCMSCSPLNVNVCYSCLQQHGLYYTSCWACSNSRCLNCSANYASCVECKAGYGIYVYMSIIYCQPCYLLCATCLGTNYLACTSCLTYYYLDAAAYACYPCTRFDPLCIDCNSTQCTLCANGSYLSGSGCVVCPNLCTACVYNPTFGAPDCTSCLNTLHNYSLVILPPTICSQFCGDLIAFDTPCDNEVGIQFDGCTDVCQVEPGFQCRKVLSVSTCSYENQIYMEIVSVEKEMFANSFTLRVKVWPPLYVFKTSDVSAVIFIDDPIFTIKSVTFDSDKSQFVLKVDFTADYLEKDIVVEFIPSQAVDARYYVTVNSTALKLVTLKYYPDWVLKTSEVSFYSSYAILVLGGTAAIIGLITKRLAGLEAIFVYQIAFLSTVWINCYLQLPFASISPLKYLNGYHQHNVVPAQSSVSRLLTVTSLSNYPFPHTQQFSFDSSMLINNFNIFFIFQIIPLISFLVTTIIVKQLTKKKVQLLKGDYEAETLLSLKAHISRATFAHELSAQSLMYFGMINLMYFLVCTYLFFRNSTQILADTFSVALFAIVAFTYALTFILFCWDPNPFDYFRYAFKKTRIALGFYYVYPLVLAATILLLVSLDMVWAPLLPIFVLLPYVIIYKPYRDNIENYRSAFNLVVMLSWLSLRLFIKYGNHSSMNNIYVFNFVNIILLVLVMILSLVSLVYSIYLHCVTQKQEKVDEQNVMCELEMMNVREGIQLAKKEDMIFKKLLEPRMNILQFSNKLIHMDGFEHEYASVESASRRIKKEIEKQRINKPVMEVVQQKHKLITELKEKMQNAEEQGIEVPVEQKHENTKLIYAMQVLKQQNHFIRLKNANDYTKKLMEQKDLDNSNNYLHNYDQI